MRPGSLVADRFEIERLAGRGGMASVYRAVDRQSGAPVALKLLNARGSVDAERFAREALVLSELTHPAIVRHVAHGRLDAGGLFLAMEWLEGEDLSERLHRSGMTPAESVLLARRIAEGLGAAHVRGVVHRDVKPSNVFLPEGAIDRAKVLDFGIAHLGSIASGMTRTGVLLGTPAYMAPEQARGWRGIDARADVFSLGCILFECLTGRAAFSGDHVMAVLAKVLMEELPRVSELCADTPPALDHLVQRMLAKEVEQRPASGADVAALLSTLGELRGERAAPMAATAPSLTANEQRLLCVVLAGSDLDDSREDGTALMQTLEQVGGTLSELRATVSRFGGRLERLLDGSVAVTLLGSGTATDQTAHAARCALAMRALLSEAPIALATGRGIVSERWPIGEAIDRAARLLRFATETPAAGRAARGICIDESTAGLLDARFEVADHGHGLELHAERAIAVASRTLLGRPTPCVGRERELSMLVATYEECVSEPVARAVVITGPAGVGKSRLRYELLREIAQRADGAEIWVGRGDPMSAGSSFGLLAQALRRAAGILDREPLATRQAKLRMRVARHMAEADQQRVTEFLGELAGAPFPEAASVQLRAARSDPQLMGDQIRRAWEDFVHAECSAHPLVLVLEDLQWGDVPTIKLVDAALRHVHDQGFMVVALARPDVLKTFPRLWEERSAAVLVVTDLTRRASERLIRAVLGPDVPSDVVARVVQRAQGNAFYLEELIRAVAGGETERLPETVLAMAQARLDALEPAARHILRAASIFGQVFSRGGVMALLGGSERTTEVRDWLAELCVRELISAREDARLRDTGSESTGPATVGRRGLGPLDQEYIFRHALVREAAYAMLTDSDRTLGHRLAGAWLERQGESDPLVLAEHFERGGEPGRSVGWYRRAAEQALEGNDFLATIERAERGVRCGASGVDLGALRLLQAEAHGWRAEHMEAANRAREALVVLEHGSVRWIRATEHVLEDAKRRAQYDLLQEMARAIALHVPSEAARGAWVGAAARAVAGLMTAGFYEMAAGVLARLEEYEPLVADDASAVAWIRNAKSWDAMYAGDTAACLALDTLVVSAFAEVGDRRNECIQRLSVAYDMLNLGAYAEADAALREVLATADRMGLEVVIATTRHNLGMTQARLGRHEEAKVIELDAARAFQAHGDQRMEAAAHIYLAEILLTAGDNEGAEHAAQAAAERVSTAPPGRAQALASVARAQLAQGKTVLALESAEAAHTLLEEIGEVEEGESLIRLGWAEALAAAGDPRAGEAIAAANRRLLERAAKIGDPGWRRSFLERIPEHARTQALFATWAAKR